MALTQAYGVNATMRRSPAVTALLVGALTGSAWCGSLPWGGPGPTRKPHPTTVALRGCTATLRTTLGDVTLDMEPDAAPNAVQAFVRFAQRGAYDGARFTTVFKGRMALAAAPAARAKADKPASLDYENAPLSATAGAVLMDRQPDGQNCPVRFLIVTTEQPHLDGDYTVFAEVTKGLDVVRRLVAAATEPNDGSPAPVEDLVIEQVVIAKKSVRDAKENPKD